MKLINLVKKLFCFHKWITISYVQHGYDIIHYQKCVKCSSNRHVIDYFNSQISEIEYLQRRAGSTEKLTDCPSGTQI